MIDYFDFDKSILSLAAYYQDRYLCTSSGQVAQTNRAMFRVVSVTSLYLSIKLRVSNGWNITPHSFARLCQGSISGEDIDRMEINILFALKWQVNPPLPIEYAHAYLDLIFASEDTLQTYHRDEELRGRILSLIQYQLDISLLDSRLFQVRSSLIAISAVLNALEGVMSESSSISPHTVEEGGCTRIPSFCRESIALVLNTASSCKTASSETELEYIRKTLLTSAVSQLEGGNEFSINGVGHSAVGTEDTHVRHYHRSSSPSSSPTSLDSMHGHTMTPHNVLSRVLATHIS